MSGRNRKPAGDGRPAAPLFADCADRAEHLRRGGADVVLVTGCELTLLGLPRTAVRCCPARCPLMPAGPVPD
jgi:hypothetical protein